MFVFFCFYINLIKKKNLNNFITTDFIRTGLIFEVGQSMENLAALFWKNRYCGNVYKDVEKVLELFLQGFFHIWFFRVNVVNIHKVKNETL